MGQTPEPALYALQAGQDSVQELVTNAAVLDEHSPAF